MHCKSTKKIANYRAVRAVASDRERKNGGLGGRSGGKRLGLRVVGDSLLDYSTDQAERRSDVVVADLECAGAESLGARRALGVAAFGLLLFVHDCE
jgi:hypothetical protein